MAKGPTYTITVELSEMELALLYHAVMSEEDEYRAVFWKGTGPLERHYVSRHWLESKVFGHIAAAQPDWLAVIEEAQKRLTPHAE